jgi:hypothetical protein
MIDVKLREQFGRVFSVKDLSFTVPYGAVAVFLGVTRLKTHPAANRLERDDIVYGG